MSVEEFTELDEDCMALLRSLTEDDLDALKANGAALIDVIDAVFGDRQSEIYLSLIQLGISVVLTDWEAREVVRS